MTEQKHDDARGASHSDAELGCICCANGHDLPKGEWCRACGLGLPAAEAKPEAESKLAAAVKAARGGDAPIKFNGYA